MSVKPHARWLAFVVAMAPAVAPAQGVPPSPPTDGDEESSEPAVATEKELVEEDDYVVRIALPTQQDREQWRNTGIRVQLGYGYGRVDARGPGASFSAHTASFRPSVRLNAHWSLGLAVRYTIARGGLSGLRWGATVEPTFHPWRGLGIALGVGYAGLIGDRPYEEPAFVGAIGNPDPVGLEEPDLQPATTTRSADPGERLEGCDGSGAVALLRIEYLMVVGPLFASGPYAQADMQKTRCTQSAGGTNLETGRPIQVRQWWTHQGWSLGWYLAWR